MQAKTALSNILKNRSASLEEVLEVFDSSPTADLEFMKGRWKGYELITGHPMEGLLDVTGWYGKLFKNAEEVHPLLFYSLNKKALYSANPGLLPLNLNLPKTKALGTLMYLLSPIVRTKKARARMRMLTYRGKLTACMIYDQKAIIDAFVKIDENTLLGAMDLKGDDRPYMFVLERDHTEYKLRF